MKKIIKCFAVTIVLIVCLSINVFADVSDTEFNFPTLTNIMTASTYHPARIKENSTSVYVNYAYATDSLPWSFVGSFLLQIHAGFDMCNVTGVRGTSSWQRPVVVSCGTKGYVKNYAYEIYGYGAMVQLYGTLYNNESGGAYGYWSPDSISGEFDTINYN